MRSYQDCLSAPQINFWVVLLSPLDGVGLINFKYPILINEFDFPNLHQVSPSKQASYQLVTTVLDLFRKRLSSVKASLDSVRSTS